MPSRFDHVRDWLPARGIAGGSSQSVLVIGLGRFGSATAARLIHIGVEVMAIDVAEALVEEWAEHLTDVRQADATNVNALEQLEATSFDAVVVAIGSHLEASILATSALNDLGCKNIWAKAITEEHGRILSRVGAHHVVYPERQAGERVAQIVTGQALDYFALDDNFVLVEIPTPTRYVGVPLGESDIRRSYGVTVVCIKPRGGQFSYAATETMPGRDDLLLVAGPVDSVGKFLKNGD